MTYLTAPAMSATMLLTPTTSAPALSPPIAERVRGWLAKYLPSKIPFTPSLDAHIEHWEPQTNYVITGEQADDANATMLELAQHFASNGGHVIWVGVTEDLHRMSEQLMFKIAGLELPAKTAAIELDAIAQGKLKYAHEQIAKLWIDFCNIEDCGDDDIEQEFLASVSSFKPTLIVVDRSIFVDVPRDPLEALVRQTYSLHMVRELRRTNPMSSVLWHLPMEGAVG